MDLLSEYVRTVLAEAAVTDEQAASQGLALYRDPSGGNEIFVLYDPEGLFDVFKEIRQKVKLASRQQQASQFIYGVMEVEPPGERCHGAAQVQYATARQGYGPMMYDIAMSSFPGGLYADRGAVSPHARKVWNFYLNQRADVEVLPFDNPDRPRTPPKEDDCPLDDPKAWAAGDSDPVDHAYRSSTSPEVSALEQNHATAIEELAASFDLPQSTILKHLTALARNFWSYR